MTTYEPNLEKLTQVIWESFEEEGGFYPGRHAQAIYDYLMPRSESQPDAMDFPEEVIVLQESDGTLHVLQPDGEYEPPLEFRVYRLTDAPF